MQIHEFAYSCHRKKRYSSEDLAKRVASRREREARKPLYVYACDHCFGWHMSSSQNA